MEWREYPLAGTGESGQVILRVLPDVLSPQLRNYRDLVVALPPGYSETGTTHPVVYMQDGQNLFDPATSYAGDWGLAEAFPEPVKPLVDASFRTRPGRSHTVIAGSSLGGLISLYGLYRYADVFGAAGVQSPALWFADGAMLRFVEDQANLAVGRVYLDIGTEEGSRALQDVRRLRELLIAAGHMDGRDLSYVEEEGGEHDEEAWGRRFRAAIPFLLGSESNDVNGQRSTVNGKSREPDR